MNEHFITAVYTKSVMRCVSECNQHDLCRTCDYDQISQSCRLFEALFATGSTIPATPFSSVMILKYCPSNQLEPDYMCTPKRLTNPYTVQYAFQKLLNVSNSKSLPYSDKTVLMTAQGFFTSSSTPHIRFYNYDGNLVSLFNYSKPVLGLTSISWVSSNSIIVGPYQLPEFQILQVDFANSILNLQLNVATLPPSYNYQPYFVYYDTSFIYVTYRMNAYPMSIHQPNGTLFSTADSQSQGYYVAFAKWNSTLYLGN
ncbi:unnamed protein product [Didymodactylos carnosus]|nr:unnamed protein product [Didymodactylos carnosus]CAF4384514.1 unnamed protein product [Didymodactylos carnosus]